jgi:hypothetical protein
MRYHVLRNVLVRDASIVLFTESEPEYRPKRLRVFQTESGGDDDFQIINVDLHYEIASADGAETLAACAFASTMMFHDNTAARRVLATEL